MNELVVLGQRLIDEINLKARVASQVKAARTLAGLDEIISVLSFMLREQGIGITDTTTTSGHFIRFKFNEIISVRDNFK